MATDQITCSAASLTLHRAVSALPSADQALLLAWTALHGVDPATIAVGRPVVRDTARRVLRWTEEVEGQAPVTRILHAPSWRGAVTWPLPFPVDLFGAHAFVDADGWTITPR